MNLVSRLLPVNHVVLENSRQIPRMRVFDSLFDREKLGSTGLGYGVAIPHGRLKSLKEPACAFVRTAQPIPFESPDGQPVSLVFAMLVPEHATEAHLELLSELAQMFSDAHLREALASTHDIQAAHRLITEWSPYAPAQRSASV
jgi:PTS system nitrogen regulatory IIA component